MEDISEAGRSTLDLSSLPRLSAFGYDGGGPSFRVVCRSLFATPGLQFLCGDGGELVVFRHGDLRALSARPEIGSPPPASLVGRRQVDGKAASPLDNPTVWVFANQAFFSNEPIHLPLRKIMMSCFGAKAAESFEPLARSTARDLIARLEDGASVDLVSAFAEPFMAQFWGAAIGLAPSARQDLAALLSQFEPLNLFVRTADQLRKLDEAFLRYRDLIEGGALSCLTRGDNATVAGVGSGLAQIKAEDDPELAGFVPRNAGAFLAGNLFEALHTAAVGVANTLHALATRPEILRVLDAEPEKIPNAVAEALRLEPPFVQLQRLVLQDLDYAGQRIAAGTRLLMLWGAGNLDPSVFPQPERFDLSRGAQPLTTFGSGTRICPGRFAATMLIRVMLEELRGEAVAFQPQEPDPDWAKGSMMNQMRRFKVRIQRR